MRQVLCLSLPEQTSKEMKSLAKTRGFASISAYIKHLVESDKDLISEATLLQSIKQARKEYRTGETIKADSLAELL